MKSSKSIKRLIHDLHDTTSADMDERILGDALGALEKSHKTSAASQLNTQRITTKSRIRALAAAAVVIVGVLIGFVMFFGTDEQPRDEVEWATGKSGGELESIEEMFKAGDVDGLVEMLTEGDFESKVASAKYLATMGAVEALEPLENLRGEYETYNTDNPFALAVEEIKNRAETGGVDDSAGIRIANAGKLAQSKGFNYAAGNKQIKGRGVDSSMQKLGATSMGEPMSFQAEAKEIADGYPIKGGGNSIAEVVPTSVYQNLVLYYSFYTGEDPNMAVDISGGNFHGQVHGAKYAKEEILGGTMSFDGEDDYISIPDIYLEGFTISAWVKTTEPDSINNRRIFMLYNEEHCYTVEGNTRGGISVGAEKMGIDETTGTPAAGESATEESDGEGGEKTEMLSSEQRWVRSDWTEGSQFSDYAWRLKPDTWTHITVTYDGVTGCIYRNGKRREYGQIPAEGFTGTVYIGGIEKHNGGFWRGMIDEVALFNRALSEEEVGQLYLMTGEMVESGPTLTEGTSGKAYYFDGDGDYIDIGTISGLGVEQTKMLWIYMESFPLPHDVYLIDEGGNNNWIELFDSDGNGVPEVRAGFDGGNYFDSDGDIEQGCWYHIAVVSWSSGDVAIYINGVLDSSRSGFSATNEPQAILIGGDSTSNIASFKGVIDEVAIFNRALSDYEIQQVYQNVGRLRGNEQGLVAYWNFDADEGDIVKDSSPYRNDGRLRDR
ncbi:MAG: LamG domain-containing protein [Planctomycetota bacterium]|jgi:hypothetical protein